MFKLDDNLLRELGLGALPPQEKNRMLAHIYETLEMRVGMRLAEGMSDQQLNEFEQLMPLQTDTDEAKKQKEQAALKWLETNFPNYKQVVADELEKLKAEIKASAAQIVAASQQPPESVPPQAA
jgi:predicted RNA-binding Zn ribbon-like protein